MLQKEAKGRRSGRKGRIFVADRELRDRESMMNTSPKITLKGGAV
jgi:hypothetical protein